jgi:hypothetical protein
LGFTLCTLSGKWLSFLLGSQTCTVYTLCTVKNSSVHRKNMTEVGAGACRPKKSAKKYSFCD